MMREILFRGKRLKNEDWVYGHYVHQYGAHEIYLPDGTNNEGFDTISIIPETVGQYTGLTDMHGTKIFEGDIIRTRNSRNKFDHVVKYGKYIPKQYCRLIFANHEVMGLFAHNENGDFQMTAYSEVYEVIGNIYDNPELIQIADGDEDGE